MTRLTKSQTKALRRVLVNYFDPGMGASADAQIANVERAETIIAQTQLELERVDRVRKATNARALDALTDDWQGTR